MKLQILLFLFFTVSLNSQAWIKKTSLPDTVEGRHHPVTFSIGEFGYVGLGSSPIKSSDAFYQYNSITDEWKLLRRFPGGARGFSIGDSYNSKGYLGFGLNDRGFLNDLWEYDPEKDSWTKKASCPCTPRAHPTFVALDGKIYVGLGSSDMGDLKDFWVYDIATDKWAQMPDLPAKPRHHPFQFGISPYLYSGMGHGGPEIFGDLFRYDPSNNTWKEMARIPAQGRVAGTQFSYNGRGYVLSGQGEDHDYLATGEFWQYEPSTDKWKELPSHPGPGRWAPGSFVIGSKIYFTCGQDSIEHLKDIWSFDFRTLASTNIHSNEVSIKNISNELLTVQSSEKIRSIQVLNAQGIFVQANVKYDPTSHSAEINTSQLNSGIFFIQVNREKPLKFFRL
ncbi:MAG: hypothetical protein HOP11_08380 [Saprospiraceae bacterium]|nr:hypothetical protein [Saprospiraceae bacterium]